MSDGRNTLCVYITTRDGVTNTAGCSSAPDVTERKLINAYLERLKEKAEYARPIVVSDTKGSLTVK
jgi:hypothetical protein